MGVEFSRGVNGEYDLGKEGGHSVRRVLHVNDQTGMSIEQILIENVKKLTNVEIKEYWCAVNLYAENFKCYGAYVLDQETNEIHNIAAKATILATGGAGKIYLYTTNPDIASGDGIAMAYRAGVIIANMEFYQFHPTCLYHPYAKSFLISEALRGEGAVLRNISGNEFMQNYHPSKELAPRDIVARANETEVIEGRGFENAYVHLDLTHLGAERIKERLPGIRDISIYFAGVDPIEAPIPVQAGQHYSMGGIGTKFDGDYGETDIAGLYTIGECSCLSVHGANRLGGNSLLETAVFGRYIGRKLLKKGLPNKPSLSEIQIAEERVINNIERLFKSWNENTGKKPVEIRNEMGETLNRNVGVYRTDKDLKKTTTTLPRLQKEFLNTHVSTEDRRFNYGLIRTLELRSMIDIAEATAYASLWRKESRGAHFRIDYPTRNDDKYLVHTMIYRVKDGLEIKTKPVKLGIFEIKERKY